MALYEFDNERAYTKYKRHVNESKERISANVVNKIQTDIQGQQLISTKTQDTSFEERLYTIFSNNLYVNSMFKELYEDGNYILMDESNGIIRDEEKRLLTLSTYASTGTLVSARVISQYGEAAEMNDFFLVSNQVVPTGSSIKWYLQNIAGERWPIKANNVNKPMHLSQNLKYGFFVVAEIERNALDESPEILDYAILYWDSEVDKALGLIDPDLSRFP